jgi:hypothetical protein
MIFAIFKTYKDIKSGVKDPTGFGQEALLEVIKAPLILFTILGILALGLFFILGFTEIIFSSLGFFRFLFWISLVLFLIFQIVIWSIYKSVKRIVERVKNRVDDEINTIKVEPK